MKMPTALTPYLKTIKWVVAFALLGLAFVGGCSYKGNKEAVERTRLESVITARDLQIQVLSAKLASVNLQATQNLQESLEQKAAAKQAVIAAEKAKKELDQKQTKWNREFERIKNNPDCKELLERQLCPLLNNY